MRIYVTGAYFTTNYGAHMMTSNFINYFSDNSRNPCDFAVSMINEEEQFAALKRTIDEGISVKRYDYRGVRVGANNLVRYAEGICTLLQDAFNPIRYRSDAVVVLGGDCISEVYATVNGIFWLALLSWMARFSKVFLLGQTIGPFYGWRIPWATRVFNRCHIYSRDQWTYDYLTNELNVSTVCPSCDLAFLDLPDQVGKEGIMERFNLEANGYFTVIISPFALHYAKDHDTYVGLWAEILEALLGMEELQGKQLVLLAHTHRTHLRNTREPEEKQMIQAVCERMDTRWDNRITKVTNLILPSEARIILGNGQFSITGRMHAAISTFQMGTPSIALAYSPKFRGVIGDELSRNDLIIENPDREVWTSGRIVQCIQEKVEYVLANRERICAEIRDALPGIKRKALFQINEMARILQSKE